MLRLFAILLLCADCPVESIRVIDGALPHQRIERYAVTSPIPSPVGQVYGMFVSPDGSVVAWIPWLDPEHRTWEDLQQPRGWGLAVQGFAEEFFADEDLYRFSEDYSTVLSRRADGALLIRRLRPPTIAEAADHDGDGDVDMIDFAALQRGEIDLDGFAGTSRLDAELFAMVAGHSPAGYGS